MKSILDTTTREELVSRIHSVNEYSPAEWGKMNSYQMIKHCRLFEEMLFSKQKHGRVLLGRLFGRIALKNILKNDVLMGRHAPTLPEFKIKETSGDFATEKTKWIALIEAYKNFPNTKFIHPFFGKMTKEQIGYFAYKHSDHHLRQFKS